MELNQVTIIGLGLIGGSLAMGLKKNRPELTIVGVDIDEEALAIAQGIQAIDWGTTHIGQGVAQADVVVLATLVHTMPAIVREGASFFKPGGVITDVGSTKNSLATKIPPLLPPQVAYVGGHPMAGAETKGIEGADPYLFENAVYVLTPLPETEQRALALVQEMVELTGARVLTMSPETHDSMVAAISHLPHLTAAALVNAVGCREEEMPGTFQLAAGGFRDATRIAAGSPSMWRSIFLDNRHSLLPMIQAYRRSLGELEEAITTGNQEALYDLLVQAQNWRQQIPAKLKGLLPGIHDVIAVLPDKPGEIGKLAALLGIKEINIMDIEILRIREGDGGTIRIGFATGEEAALAVEALQKNDYSAWLKN